MESVNKKKDVRGVSLSITSMMLDDIPNGMRLSSSEQWNQTENDWQLFINDTNNICLQAAAEDKVVGTTTAINYSNQEVWIGMVLVDKDYRGLGISKALLTNIFEKVSAFAVKLDATPAGQLVYEKFGFKDEYLVSRMVCQQLNSLPNVENDVDVTQMQPEHINEIITLDAMAFGIERRKLIEYLTAMYGNKCWILKRNNNLVGFVLGRDGSRFHHVGPLVAFNNQDAKLLLTKALRSLTNQSIVVDVLCDKAELINWLIQFGFVEQRHFIRMYKENNPFPGKTDNLFLIAGPEFG